MKPMQQTLQKRLSIFSHQIDRFKASRAVLQNNILRQLFIKIYESRG